MNLTRRTFLGGVSALAVQAGLAGCVATNPATGRTSFTGLYSLDDDKALGMREYPKLIKAFGGEYEDKRLAAYVRAIGNNLATGTEYADLPYTFTVLNTPIVNAMALPGGYIGITRGLLTLASNEAEMAGVLAHELGHVNARHQAERLSQGLLAQLGVFALGVATRSSAVTNLAAQGAAAFLKSYSRDQEFEADMLGVRYLSRAGYDPDAMVTFLSSLREESILEATMMGLPAGKVDEFNMMSTHPRTVDRVKRAMERAATAPVTDPRIGRNDYLNAIDGIMYGDDPEQGIVDGRVFAHPGLRFEFAVPHGFRLRNGEKRIVAQHADGAAIVFDLTRPKSARSMADYITREWAPKTTLNDLQTLRVNGLPAATAVTVGKTNSGRVDVRLVAIRRADDSVARFIFVTPQAITARMAEDLQRTTYSYRNLTKAEASRIRPKRLVVQRARSRDTVGRLARGLPYGEHNESWFRVLNDMGGDERLRSGQRVKVVTS